MASTPSIHPYASVAHTPAARTGSGSPVAFAVLFYLFMLPSQFFLEVGGVLITPFRIGLAIGVIYYILALVRRSITFHLPDLLVIGTIAWIYISLMNTMPLDRALSGGGLQTFDVGLAYFSGRAAVKTARDLRVFLILVAPVLGILGVVLLMESYLQVPIVQNLAMAITGNPGNSPGVVVRFGLMRAFGPFPHPILAGIFVASLLPMFVLSGIRGWPRLAGILGAIGGVFSFSSAAFLVLVVNIGLLIYNRLTELIGNLSWKLLIAASVMAMVVIQVSTNAGVFRLILRYAAFNRASAANRVRIWEYGTQNVADNPIFGIGYNDWVRPNWISSSVDNYWLLVAMQFGIPAIILVMTTIVLAMLFLGRAMPMLSSLDRRLYIGVSISLFTFTLAAFSVAIWLSAQAWYYALLGIAVSLGHDAFRDPMRPT